MAREKDLDDSTKQVIVDNFTFEVFKDRPWTPAPKAKDRRLAVISTGAFHTKGDRPFGFGAFDWRALPAGRRNLHSSQNSVNWDRTGIIQDINTAYPIDRLHEAVADGRLGSLANTNYSFNGATTGVAKYEPYAKEVAARLKQDDVNTVLLCPV